MVGKMYLCNTICWEEISEIVNRKQIPAGLNLCMIGIILPGIQ